MSEQSLAVALRKAFKRAFPQRESDWQRFEDKMSVGIPDVHAIANERDWWIELKYLDAPPVRKVNLGIRVEQALWLRGRWRCKRNTCVLFKIAGDKQYYIMAGRDAFHGSIDVALFWQLDIKVFGDKESALHALFTEGLAWSDNTLALT